MILVIQDILKGEDDELAGDIMTTEIIAGKAYTRPAIKLKKGKTLAHPYGKKIFIRRLAIQPDL